MVALTLLLVGLLGTVKMIDGAIAVTTENKGREGATALARSVLEIARGVQYRDLTGAQVVAELEARPGLDDADAATAGHQVESRDFVYTVTPTVCSMDDDKDGLGDHAEPAITFCADSSGTGSDDRNPDDYRRVTVRLDWSLQGGRTESLSQRALVTNPVGGLGPSVASLTPDVPDDETIATGIQTATCDIVTSGVADAVSLSVNGALLGDATGADTTWDFDWDLGPVDTPRFVDCTYVLRADAFDDKGRAGTPSALTVTLNRRQPFAPPTFAGGRNLNGAFVDLQWEHSRECDVTEYRVYRGTDPEAIDTQVCERLRNERPACIDEQAPGGQPLYYQVVGIDRSPLGVAREGDRSPYLEVGSETGNQPPSAPASVSVCLGGGVDPCTDIDGEPAPTGTAVLSWPESTDPDGEAIRFYRVYRAAGEAGPGTAPAYADRFDVLFKVSGKPLVFVDSTAAGTQSYWVTAVDDRFGESEPVGPVVWQP